MPTSPSTGMSSVAAGDAWWPAAEDRPQARERVGRDAVVGVGSALLALDDPQSHELAQVMAARRLTQVELLLQLAAMRLAVRGRVQHRADDQHAGAVGERVQQPRERSCPSGPPTWIASG
jgi:hypothetical protein